MFQSGKDCRKSKIFKPKRVMEADDMPERPFDIVSADLFHSGGNVFMTSTDWPPGFSLVDL